MSRNSKTSVPSKAPDPVGNQSHRFHEACEAMKKNAARFADCELSSDSSEEEIDEAEVMRKTLSNYADDETQDLRKIREFLQDILTSGAVVCLICIESVKRSDQVWSCTECYCVFHLHCIQKWAKDSMHHLSTSTLDQKKREHIKWCCPKCRCGYEPSERPSSYLCFCGKVEAPPFSQWGVPHACEGACEKRLRPDCGHTCCLLCHPGPCPPCPQTVLVSCCCSKSAKVSRRCSHKEWHCGKPCGKTLSCKIHKCEESCHSGDCPPCKRESRQKCDCGAESRLRPCHDANWRCGKVCGKPLACGNHNCDATCHSGACTGCPGSGPRPCPCGKLCSVLPCTESVQPCGDTCGKLLECRLHRCSQRCHTGPCEKCLQMRVMRCRCGQREKSVPCRDEFCCDAKCRNRRDCGRHNCSRKCCVGNCPPCELPCGKTLNCGKHKCASLCHPGPCYPCHELAVVSCSCGSTRISVPCGRKKTAVPPRCTSDCRLPPDCHHLARHRHKCHFGACPGCRLVCDKPLECGHSCPVRCHSAVLTKIDTKQKKDGPWDLKNSYRMELVCKPCPPCAVPVPVTCLGGHETHPLRCSEAISTSCGQKCGRALSCGNHGCNLQCHLVEHPEDLVKLSRSCETCQEPCRHPGGGCPHPCPLPCHPGKCRPCRQHLKLKCHCGINTMYVACCDWTKAGEEGRDKLITCSNRCPKEIPCGHRCIHSCHLGPCSSQADCKKKVTLRCPCKRKKKEVPCNTLLPLTRLTHEPCPIPSDENSKPRPTPELRPITRDEDSKPRLLSCDDDCSAHKEAELASESEKLLLQKEAELKAQEKELQEFLKKTEGKKKRKKKQVESPVEDNRRVKMLLVGAFVVCVVGCIIYVLSA